MNEPTATPALPEPVCPLCGGPNGCVPARSGSFAEPCWCTQVAFPPELLAKVPAEKAGRACICRRCAEEARE